MGIMIKELLRVLVVDLAKFVINIASAPAKEIAKTLAKAGEKAVTAEAKKTKANIKKMIKTSKSKLEEKLNDKK